MRLTGSVLLSALSETQAAKDTVEVNVVCRDIRDKKNEVVCVKVNGYILETVEALYHPYSANVSSCITMSIGVQETAQSDRPAACYC